MGSMNPSCNSEVWFIKQHLIVSANESNLANKRDAKTDCGHSKKECHKIANVNHPGMLETLGR